MQLAFQFFWMWRKLKFQEDINDNSRDALRKKRKNVFGDSRAWLFFVNMWIALRSGITMCEIRKCVTDINSSFVFCEDASSYRVSCRLLNSPSTILATQSDNKHENKPTILVIRFCRRLHVQKLESVAFSSLRYSAETPAFGKIRKNSLSTKSRGMTGLR